MPPTCASALAAPFTHTSGAPDFTLTFGLGTSPVTGSLASGTYWMWLAPSTSCCPRKLAAAMKAAINGARSSGCGVIASLSASGVVTFEFVVDIPATVTLSSPLWEHLGFEDATPTVTANGTIVGARPVWHLALLRERISSDWSPRTAMAGGTAVDGVGYGVSSGVTTCDDELRFGWIPRDPTFRATLTLDQTPWEPEPDYLTVLGTPAGRLYSLSDLVVAEAHGRTLAFARGNFQALRTSTTERYDLVSLPIEDCARPRLARSRAGWDAYRTWTTRMIRQSTPTGTRA